MAEQIHNTSHAHLSVAHIARRFIFLYKKYFTEVLLFGFLNALLYLVQFFVVGHSRQIAAAFLAWVITVALLAVFTLFIDRSEQGKKTSLAQAARRVAKRLPAVISVQVLLFAILFFVIIASLLWGAALAYLVTPVAYKMIGIGILAFLMIVVLVYFCIIFSQGFYLALLRDEHPLEALEESQKLTKHSRMTLFIVFLAFLVINRLLINILPESIPNLSHFLGYLFTVFTSSAWAVGWYVVWELLTSPSHGKAEEQESLSAKRHIAVMATFRDGVRLYKKYFSVLTVLCLIYAACSLTLHDISTRQLTTVTQLLDTVLLYAVFIGSMTYINKREKKQEVTGDELVGQAMSKMWGIIIVGFLIILSITVVNLVLFIPSIIGVILHPGVALLALPVFLLADLFIYAIFGQASYFVLFRKKSALAAMSASENLTKGSRLNIAILYAGFVVLFLAVALVLRYISSIYPYPESLIVFILEGIFPLPFIMAILYAIWNDLSHLRRTTA